MKSCVVPSIGKAYSAANVNMHGFGIPVFSKVEDECMKCDSKFAWPLYLALVLIPITLFYILVIIFNLSATHPPIAAYILYCQLFAQTVSNFRFMRHRPL